MNNKDNIKRKIKALLAKTTENGASEEEALSALKKAQSLMMENFISEHELTDPYLLEKCVFREVDIVKSGYDLTVFYPCLSELFDCKHYYNSRRITFFGFEEDTELCAYFYNFIIKSCLTEKDRYMRSKEYKYYKDFYHGKTLVASFIRGFLVGISRKMMEMYKERESTVSKEVGLMVISKINKVQTQYEEANIQAKKVSVRGGNYKAEAFYNGYEKGQDVPLTQGISDCKAESILMISDR